MARRPAPTVTARSSACSGPNRTIRCTKGTSSVTPIMASARYLLVDVADVSLATIDIGLLAAGPLWRLGRGMAYGVREGRLILDQRDRNPLTGAEFVIPALANPRFAAFTLPTMSRAEATDAHRDLVRRLGAARDALWIPETADTRAETNRRAI